MIHVCNTIQLYLHFVCYTNSIFMWIFLQVFFRPWLYGGQQNQSSNSMVWPLFNQSYCSWKILLLSSYGDIFFLFINYSFTRDISVRRKPWFFKLKIEILTTYQYCNYGDSFLFTNYGGSVRSPNSQSFNQWRPQTKH